MRKYKKSFNAMLIAIVLIIIPYILKNLGSIFQWREALQILFYSYLMGINLIVLCLTIASKVNMEEIIDYNPYNKSEKYKNRKFVKWYMNTIKNEKIGWKGAVIVICIIIGEICLFYFEKEIKVIAICDIVLDIMTVIGIGSAFVQIHINNTIRQHLEENEKSHKSS